MRIITYRVGLRSIIRSWFLSLPPGAVLSDRVCIDVVASLATRSATVQWKRWVDKPPILRLWPNRVQEQSLFQNSTSGEILYRTLRVGNFLIKHEKRKKIKRILIENGKYGKGGFQRAITNVLRLSEVRYLLSKQFNDTQIISFF